MMPKKPVIVKTERLFRSILKDKIANTFNDKNRMLFRHMLAIIDFEGDKDSDKTTDMEHIVLNIYGRK